MKLFAPRAWEWFPAAGAFTDGIRFRLAESYGHNAQSLKIKSCGILRFHRNFSEQPIEF